jgi:hypothetical protein
MHGTENVNKKIVVNIVYRFCTIIELMTYS